MADRLLGRLASACARQARWVTAAAFTLALVAAGLAFVRLGIDTDADALFSSRLPWVQQQAALKRAFPQNGDLVVAVIDGAIPEEADATATDLADALRHDTAHFLDAHDPEASPYFARNGLLFVGHGPLEALLDQTIDAQPFLGKLAADPSLAGLVGALSLIAQGVSLGQAELTPFLPAMQSFHQAFANAGPGQPLSWETLLAGPLVDLGGRFHFVLARPRPGAAALPALRAAAARLEFVRAGTARVRVTGAEALQEDAVEALTRGAAIGLSVSLLLILVWLYLAVGTWRLIVPIVLTLLLGLALTTGFAAVAVGSLSLVSGAYAILLVGPAMDFAIQFAVRFRDDGGSRPGLVPALREMAQRCGGPVLLAALLATASFLAFTPTVFVGMAQLGLLVGVGILIAFACTLTVLPALIALCRPRAEAARAGFSWGRRLAAFATRRRRVFLGGAGLVALAGAAALPWLPFDSDPLHANQPDAESMLTLSDLGEDPLTSPYRVEVLQRSVAAAQEDAARLSRLPTVAGVLSIDSLVPEDQPQKLALIADAAAVLGPTLNVVPAPHPDATATRAALQEALPAMTEAARLLPAGHPFSAIVADLIQLQAAPDARIAQADAALTRFLPLQLARLRMVLQAAPVTRADIPAELARDWVTPDGKAKLEVLPTREASENNAGLRRFVAEVVTVEPDAAGAAVTIVRSASAILDSFEQALAYALAAVVVILLLAFRHRGDTALVLIPVLVSGLVIALVAVASRQSVTVANVIALPLLLGIGAAFNVYLVSSWRAGITRPPASATARARLLSALATATVFGPLALSAHPGTASLGRLVVTGLAVILAVNLLVAPALLATVGTRRQS